MAKETKKQKEEKSMLKKMVQKMVDSAIAKKLGMPEKDDSAMQEKLAALEKENAQLKEAAEQSGPAQRLKKLKDMAAQIPDDAQGMGMMMVLEDGVMKKVELKSKADINTVIARAEKGEIEVLLS